MSDELLKYPVQGVPDLFSGKVADSINCPGRGPELVLDGSDNLKLNCELGPELLCRLCNSLNSSIGMNSRLRDQPLKSLRSNGHRRFWTVHAGTTPSTAGNQVYGAVCSTCKDQPECLDYAQADSDAAGFWGGTSERERRTVATTTRLQRDYNSRPNLIKDDAR